jgi:hypothetical protein
VLSQNLPGYTEETHEKNLVMIANKLSNWCYAIAQSDAGFSPQRSGFSSRRIHVVFVVDKVALAGFSLRTLGFSLLVIIP